MSNARNLGISSSSGAKAAIPDLAVFGDPDAWELICKASSKAQGFMKSTKRMRVHGGYLYQTCTMQRNDDGSWAVADALAFVPGPEQGGALPPPPPSSTQATGQSAKGRPTRVGE